MPTAEDILNTARGLLGITESPPGSNIVHPILDWYGEQGIQWCAAFVAFVYWHTPGGSDLIDGIRSAYSGDYLSIGQESGPVPAAICIMDYASQPGNITDHIGIVESVSGSSFVNIEGNHNSRVERVSRNLHDGNKYWFRLPAYQEQPEEETEMALMTSGVPVTLFSASINPVDGDAWTKIYNPSTSAIGGRVSFSTSKAVSFTVQPNKVAVFSAVGNGAAGETQINVTADKPVVVTVKQ